MGKPSLLSHRDLQDMANHLDMPGSGSSDRRKLLATLIEFFAPGDGDFKTAVIEADKAERRDPLKLLAEEPLFEMTWDEMDDDDKKEHGDLKKAISRQRVQKRGTKRQFACKAKAKSKAKAKAGPPPPPSPPPLPPLAEIEAVLLAPVGPPPSSPHVMKGDYKYVSFRGCHIVFSADLKKINAHCLCAL